jgi:hypothetical protein
LRMCVSSRSLSFVLASLEGTHRATSGGSTPDFYFSRNL